MPFTGLRASRTHLARCLHLEDQRWKKVAECLVSHQKLPICSVNVTYRLENLDIRVGDEPGSTAGSPVWHSSGAPPWQTMMRQQGRARPLASLWQGATEVI